MGHAMPVQGQMLVCLVLEQPVLEGWRGCAGHGGALGAGQRGLGRRCFAGMSEGKNTAIS